MPGDWIHSLSPAIRIGGHDPAGNQTWVTTDKRFSRPRRRRTNLQRPHRRRPCLCPAGSQQILSSNEGLARPRSRPKRIRRRGPRTRPDNSDRVTGQGGAKVGGSFHRQDEGVPQRVQANHAIWRGPKAFLEYR
jgi:hypothetical protein